MNKIMTTASRTDWLLIDKPLTGQGSVTCNRNSTEASLSLSQAPFDYVANFPKLQVDPELKSVDDSYQSTENPTTVAFSEMSEAVLFQSNATENINTDPSMIVATKTQRIDDAIMERNSCIASLISADGKSESGALYVHTIPEFSADNSRKRINVPMIGEVELDQNKRAPMHSSIAQVDNVNSSNDGECSNSLQTGDDNVLVKHDTNSYPPFHYTDPTTCINFKSDSNFDRSVPVSVNLARQNSLQDPVPTATINHGTVAIDSELSPNRNSPTGINKKQAVHRGIVGSSIQTEHCCNLCSKRYRHGASLRNHMEKHATGQLRLKRYKCTRCTYSSHYHRNVTKHMEKHNGELPTSPNVPFPGVHSASPCGQMNPEELKANLVSSHAWGPHDKTEHGTFDSESETTAGVVLKARTSSYIQAEPILADAYGNYVPQEAIPAPYQSFNIQKQYEGDSIRENMKPTVLPSQARALYRCDVSGCDRSFRSAKYLSNHTNEHRDVRKVKKVKRHINDDKKLATPQTMEQTRYCIDPSQKTPDDPFRSMNHMNGYDRVGIGGSLDSDYGQSIVSTENIAARRRYNLNYTHNSNFVQPYRNDVSYYYQPNQSGQPPPSLSHNPNLHHSSNGNEIVNPGQTDVYSFPSSGVATNSHEFYTLKHSEIPDNSTVDRTILKQRAYTQKISQNDFGRLTVNFNDASVGDVPLASNISASSQETNLSFTNIRPNPAVYSSHPNIHPLNDGVIHRRHYAMNDVRTVELPYSEQKLASAATTAGPIAESSVLSIPQQHSSIGSDVLQPTILENYPPFDRDLTVDPQTSPFNYDNEPPADTVEQLLDKPDLPATVLDRMLRQSDHTKNLSDPVVNTPIEDTNEMSTQMFVSHSASITSTANSATSNMANIIDDNNNNNNSSELGQLSNAVGEQDVTFDTVPVTTVTPETEAFFTDLQEILARDLPLLNTSTPRCSSDLSETTSLVTSKEQCLNPRSPFNSYAAKHLNVASLRSADSGLDSWSSSSCCSVGPNSISLWSQQDSANSQASLSAATSSADSTVLGIYDGQNMGPMSEDPVHSFTPQSGICTDKGASGSRCSSVTLEGSNNNGNSILGTNTNRTSVTAAQWSNSPESIITSRSNQLGSSYRIYSSNTGGATYDPSPSSHGTETSYPTQTFHQQDSFSIDPAGTTGYLRMDMSRPESDRPNPLLSHAHTTPNQSQEVVHNRNFHPNVQLDQSKQHAIHNPNSLVPSYSDPSCLVQSCSFQPTSHISTVPNRSAKMPLQYDLTDCLNNPLCHGPRNQLATNQEQVYWQSKNVVTGSSASQELCLADEAQPHFSRSLGSYSLEQQSFNSIDSRPPNFNTRDSCLYDNPSYSHNDYLMAGRVADTVPSNDSEPKPAHPHLDNAHNTIIPNHALVPSRSYLNADNQLISNRLHNMGPSHLAMRRSWNPNQSAPYNPYTNYPPNYLGPVLVQQQQQQQQSSTPTTPSFHPSTYVGSHFPVQQQNCIRQAQQQSSGSESYGLVHPRPNLNIGPYYANQQSHSSQYYGNAYYSHQQQTQSQTVQPTQQYLLGPTSRVLVQQQQQNRPYSPVPSQCQVVVRTSQSDDNYPSFDRNLTSRPSIPLNTEHPKLPVHETLRPNESNPKWSVSDPAYTNSQSQALIVSSSTTGSLILTTTNSTITKSMNNSNNSGAVGDSVTNMMLSTPSTANMNPCESVSNQEVCQTSYPAVSQALNRMVTLESITSVKDRNCTSFE